jgi:hypothetical protein
MLLKHTLCILVGLLILSGCGAKVDTVQNTQDDKSVTVSTKLENKLANIDTTDKDIKNEEIKNNSLNTEEEVHSQKAISNNYSTSTEKSKVSNENDKPTANDTKQASSTNETQKNSSITKKPYPPKRLESFEYKHAKLGGVNTDLEVHYNNIEKMKQAKNDFNNRIGSLIQEISDKQLYLEQLSKKFNDPALKQDYDEALKEYYAFQEQFYKKYPSYPDNMDMSDPFYVKDQKTLLALDTRIRDHEITILDRDITNLQFRIKEKQRELENLTNNYDIPPIDYDFEIELSEAIIEYLLDHYRYD